MTTTTVNPLSTIAVRDVMAAPIISVDPSASVREIAALMSERRVHCVVVNGADQRAAAVVSDLDLVAALADGGELTAGDIAATEVLTVGHGWHLERVARLLRGHECTHALVLEGGEPVGVVSTLDIARAAAAG